MCLFVTRCYKNNPQWLSHCFSQLNESKIVFWFGFMNEIKLLSSCEGVLETSFELSEV